MYQSVKPAGAFVSIMGFGYNRDYGALGNLVEYSVIAKWYQEEKYEALSLGNCSAMCSQPPHCSPAGS